MLVLVAAAENYERVLPELMAYANEVDVELACTAVRAIGRIRTALDAGSIGGGAGADAALSRAICDGGSVVQRLVAVSRSVDADTGQLELVPYEDVAARAALFWLLGECAPADALPLLRSVVSAGVDDEAFWGSAGGAAADPDCSRQVVVAGCQGGAGGVAQRRAVAAGAGVGGERRRGKFGCARSGAAVSATVGGGVRSGGGAGGGAAGGARARGAVGVGGGAATVVVGDRVGSLGDRAGSQHLRRPFGGYDGIAAVAFIAVRGSGPRPAHHWRGGARCASEAALGAGHDVGESERAAGRERVRGAAESECVGVGAGGADAGAAAAAASRRQRHGGGAAGTARRARGRRQRPCASDRHQVQPAGSAVLCGHGAADADISRGVRGHGSRSVSARVESRRCRGAAAAAAVAAGILGGGCALAIVGAAGRRRGGVVACGGRASSGWRACRAVVCGCRGGDAGGVVGGAGAAGRGESM
eukprot:ctg_274.g112